MKLKTAVLSMIIIVAALSAVTITFPVDNVTYVGTKGFMDGWGYDVGPSILAINWQTAQAMPYDFNGRANPSKGSTFSATEMTVDQAQAFGYFSAVPNYYRSVAYMALWPATHPDYDTSGNMAGLTHAIWFLLGEYSSGFTSNSFNTYLAQGKASGDIDRADFSQVRFVEQIERKSDPARAQGFMIYAPVNTVPVSVQ